MRKLLEIQSRGMLLSLAGALVVLALIVTSCGGDQAANESTKADSEKIKITVATLPITSNAVIELGNRKGWFAEQNLEVEIQTIPNPPAVIAALQGGQVQFGYSPTMPLLNAVSEGIELRIAAPADGYPDGAWEEAKAEGGDAAAKFDDTAVLVPEGSDIESPADLVGKKVAVPARKAQLEVTVAKIVKEDGGDPDGIEWIALGFPEMQSALEAGRVHAIATVDPFTAKAQEAGATAIAYPGLATFQEGAVGVWMATQSFADENPEAIESFREVILKANKYANEHPDEILEIAAETTQTPMETLKASHLPYWPSEPVDPIVVDRAAQAMVDLGYLKEKPDSEQLVLSAGS